MRRSITESGESGPGGPGERTRNTVHPQEGHAMKRFVAYTAALLGAVGLLAGAVPVDPAGAQSGARIHLIHGIPDTPVDVSAIAHLDAEGTPTLTVFDNDTSAVAAGQGRLVVRHTAAAPAVDVRANGEVALPNLSNPNEASADLPAGTISADVVPTGASEPVVIGPADLPITEGSSLIVYAVGSLDGGTLQTLTETIHGLGSGPDAVQTGNSPVSDDSGSALPWVLAAGLGTLAAGTVVGRRALAA